MQDPLLPKSSVDDDIVMVDVSELDSDDDSFGSDFDALTEADDLPEKPERSNLPSYALIAQTPTAVEPPRPPSPAKSTAQRTSKPVQAESRPQPPYPRPGSMCVICKIKPVYHDERGSFPTCGITCAQKLQATKIPQSTIMQGHMNNPRNYYDLRSGPSGHTNEPWQISSARTGQIRMCEVGYTPIFTASSQPMTEQLHPPGPIEMCDYCKKRPKVILNGKKFPHCGRTCRDNAKMATVAATSATCKTCLACWKAERSRDSSDFCSQLCEMGIENRAPILVEVPRGHASFKKVAEVFTDSWKKIRGSGTIPTIKKIYMVYTSASSRSKQDQYRNRLSQSSLFQRKANSQSAWLGTPPECGFGDAGNVEPCSSKKCLLCSVVRSSVSPEHFPEGIPTTTLLPRAIEIASNARRRTSKVVLLTSVAFGSIVEKSDLRGPLPPQGYDSVHLVSYPRFGGKLDLGETFVFNDAAIKPKYLISFE
ncbi:hypothetical protein CPB84DRAFT_1847047 [Gymnopilus junonius]|uniref:Uncharacterized protein n=1 Tax=Gymnopilus junonius TaxID=109634 RepID=A0A9P5TP35_GYMJU|nr:hypothetical protein CPB84DRAFT_1847047 [Gymnopilus junonius]